MSVFGSIGKIVGGVAHTIQQAQQAILAALEPQMKAVAQVLLSRAASFKTAAEIRAAATAETVKLYGPKPHGQDPALVASGAIRELLRTAPPSVLKGKAFQDLKKEQDDFDKIVDSFLKNPAKLGDALSKFR